MNSITEEFTLKAEAFNILFVNNIPFPEEIGI